MATNPVQPPVPAAPTKPADAHYDEMSGVYGFFRRHQKKLLYTAGLFTLLTFSITGSVMGVAENLVSSGRTMPTIEVNGKRIALEPEDYEYGQVIARNFRALPAGVLPELAPGDGNENQLLDVLAVLRRAAIAEGIEYSFDEVDRAIESERDRWKAESAARMARQRSFASLAHYRSVVAEAMRIGTYVRLQTLALDDTDARVLHSVTSDREKITLRVATFDEKVAETALKAGKTLTDEELRAWLDGKTDGEKMQMSAFDLPRAQLRFGALMLAEFDAEQWRDSHLKDFTVSDDQLKNLYNVERDTRFKVEGQAEPKPFEDEAVKAELTKLVQAEHVMNQLLASLKARQNEALKSQTEELSRTQGELGSAETSLREIEQTVADKQQQLAAKEKELEAKPGDEALTKARDAAKAELQTAEEQQFQAKEKVPALKAAAEAAETALKDARAQFDFTAAFQELTKDKHGAVTKAMEGMKNAEELKDLDALGLELGKWPSAVPLRAKGDLAFAPGRTSKAVVLYQAMDAEPRPLKPWEQLKPLAEGAYWTEQAKKLGEEKKKVMEDALLRLAKAKMQERVTELEGQRQQRVDDKVTEWETKTQAEITKAQQILADLPPNTRMRASWQQALDGFQAELAQKEQRRKAIEAEVDKAIADEIATEAKKHYRDVLDAAAAEAGFTTDDLGPYARDVQQLEPRFDKAFPPAVVYLWRSQSKLKEGEATGVLHDATNRAWHVAVCTKVEPVGPDDVSRRDFESLRTGNGRFSFATQQSFRAYATAFTIEAIEARYGLQRTGEAREQSSVKDAAGK